MLKSKNVSLAFLLSLVLLLIMTGCGSTKNTFIDKEVNPQIDVFGVKLNMDESSVHSAIGSNGEKAMCINGYEFEYAEKKINVGFNLDTKKARRITSKNPETSIYGIKPGTELNEAYKALTSNGFIKDESSKYKFHKENILVSIISMKGTHADGISVEINPE